MFFITRMTSNLLPVETVIFHYGLFVFTFMSVYVYLAHIYEGHKPEIFYPHGYDNIAHMK